VEPIISDLPAAGWPACGRQGEDYMCAVRLRRIEVSPLRPPCPRAEACLAWRAGEVGSEASRKGKAPPLERGRGRYSPPASPIGSLRKPWSEGMMGSTCEILNLE